MRVGVVVVQRDVLGHQFQCTVLRRSPAPRARRNPLAVAARDPPACLRTPIEVSGVRAQQPGPSAEGHLGRRRIKTFGLGRPQLCLGGGKPMGPPGSDVGSPPKSWPWARRPGPGGGVAALMIASVPGIADAPVPPQPMGSLQPARTPPNTTVAADKVATTHEIATTYGVAKESPLPRGALPHATSPQPMGSS